MFLPISRDAESGSHRTHARSIALAVAGSYHYVAVTQLQLAVTLDAKVYSFRSHDTVRILVSCRWVDKQST